jgi:hypothetical protein
MKLLKKLLRHFDGGKKGLLNDVAETITEEL